MSLKAVTHISQVRGGSQARIMLADDGRKYVTKLMGNPQCTRVLANDYLACRLARMIGLSVPEPVIIHHRYQCEGTIRPRLSRRPYPRGGNRSRRLASAAFEGTMRMAGSHKNAASGVSRRAADSVSPANRRGPEHPFAAGLVSAGIRFRVQPSWRLPVRRAVPHAENTPAGQLSLF